MKFSANKQDFYRKHTKYHFPGVHSYTRIFYYRLPISHQEVLLKDKVWSHWQPPRITYALLLYQPINKVKKKRKKKVESFFFLNSCTSKLLSNCGIICHITNSGGQQQHDRYWGSCPRKFRQLLPTQHPTVVPTTQGNLVPSFPKL